jgi:hypothetical protein
MMGRPGTEDTLLGSGLVSSRMDTQDVSPGAIQPGKEEDLVARPETPETFDHLCLQALLELRLQLASNSS